jgi:hypothetical protein
MEASKWKAQCAYIREYLLRIGKTKTRSNPSCRIGANPVSDFNQFGQRQKIETRIEGVP